MKKKTKVGIIIGAAVGGLAVATLATWIIVGYKVEWGPFAFLAFDAREKEILKTYDSTTRKDEIVFYGASNFRLWKEMDEDMLPFVVQNHGFGGSTDNDLMERADRLLYPYEPAVVVFQTGSNDYAKISGTNEEKFDKITNNKIKMFDTFHDKLPNTTFVVVSGILMPGRSQYDEVVHNVNTYLSNYCLDKDYMYYVDAESMTIDENGNHISDMFISDGIHLTHESRIKWAEGFIKPTLDQVANAHPEYTHIKTNQ